jgi:hypothetical protein
MLGRPRLIHFSLVDWAFAGGRRRSQHGRRDLNPRGLKLSELSGQRRSWLWNGFRPDQSSRKMAKIGW